MLHALPCNKYVYIIKLLQTWCLKTEGNKMGVMIYLN